METWVFDLDNTLYPHHLNLWQQVDERIRDFIADSLKVGPEQAFRIQKDYYRRYGTTLRGLMTEHGLEPDDFLEFVHAIDHSPLEPNPELGAAIQQLNGRKLILTNGTRRHAEQVMQRLAIHEHSTGSSISSQQNSCRNRSRRPTSVSSQPMRWSREGPPCSRISHATSRPRTPSA